MSEQAICPAVFATVWCKKDASDSDSGRLCRLLRAGKVRRSQLIRSRGLDRDERRIDDVISIVGIGRGKHVRERDESEGGAQELGCAGAHDGHESDARA